MKHWKRWAVLALVVVAVTSGLWRAVNKRQTQQVLASQAGAPTALARALEVQAQDIWTAQTVSLDLGVNFTGSTRSLHSAVVKARVAGELRGLNVREGDRVRAGEVLARTDDSDARARLQQAQEQAQAAKAQLAIAKRQQDNNQALVQQGFISPTALDTSRANLDAAQANLQSALAGTDVARKALEDTVLRAPISGQVATRVAQNGERLPVDGKVLEIVDPDALEVEVALPPAAALTLRVGQTAQWSVEGQAQAATARVTRISPSVQTGSRSVLAYLSLPANVGLRQGLFVQGRIVTGQLKAVAVPLSAIRHDKPQPYVLAVRDGQVQHLPVQAGIQGLAGSEDMAVVEAVREGTPVLRASVGLLAAGTPVRLTAPEAPAGSR